MFPTNEKIQQPAMEAEILKFWEDHHVFDKLVAQNANGKPWLLLDGPVTANNRLGVHHGWGRTYKDIFQRFHAMKGERCRWQNGFDCHGLWVEVEVEKDGHWKKQEIPDRMGEFIGQCQDRTFKFDQIITEQSERLGQWNHWNKSYRTDSTKNIEAIWKFLQTCGERDMLKQGYRVMPWCTRCGTSLSHHEMADSYEDRKDTSIYFLCPLVASPGQFMLVWTTTPWTIPANVSLAVKPDAEYVRMGTASGQIWMSQAHKSQFYPDAQHAETRMGAAFIDAGYTPPFLIHENIRDRYKIIAWDKIDPNEGSGIVHIAPGCGAEDYALIRGTTKLGSFIPTDQFGIFSKECGERFEGMHWTKVNKYVIELLEQNGLLVSTSC